MLFKSNRWDSLMQPRNIGAFLLASAISIFLCQQAACQSSATVLGVGDASVSVDDSRCSVLATTFAPKIIDIMVKCGSRGISLGQAESYASSYNSKADALAVVIRRPDRMLVYVISPKESGEFQVDEISRDIAKSLKRRVDTENLLDTNIHLDTFGADARITVSPDVSKVTGQKPSGTGGPITETGAISIDAGSYAKIAKLFGN